MLYDPNLSAFHFVVRCFFALSNSGRSALRWLAGRAVRAAGAPSPGWASRPRAHKAHHTTPAGRRRRRRSARRVGQRKRERGSCWRPEGACLVCCFAGQAAHQCQFWFAVRGFVSREQQQQSRVEYSTVSVAMCERPLEAFDPSSYRLLVPRLNSVLSPFLIPLPTRVLGPIEAGPSALLLSSSSCKQRCTPPSQLRTTSKPSGPVRFHFPFHSYNASRCAPGELSARR